MKNIIILLAIIMPCLLCAQNGVVIEAQYSRNFSLTDQQLAQQKELIDLLTEHYEGGYYDPEKEVAPAIKSKVESLINIPSYDPDMPIWSTQEPGCSWYCGAMYSKEVSSSLPSQGNNHYDKSVIFDDDVRTAWVEGAEGYGVGQYIEFFFPQASPQATACYIVNGYNKNERTWKNNSRVKSFNIYENDELIASVNLQDIRDEQTFKFPFPIPRYHDEKRMISRPVEWTEEEVLGSVIKFMITDVYKGDKYDDTAISELYFDGIGVHCLAEGTQIRMADDSEKNIEDIEVGDTVRTYDAISRVKAVHQAQHPLMFEITDSDGRRIVITDDHPLWGQSGWISINPAKTKNYDRYRSLELTPLTIGSGVCIDGGMAEVVSIRAIEDAPESYTLELEDETAPFMANGFWVGQE